MKGQKSQQQFIDKLVLIDIRDRKILMTKARGKDAWLLPGGKREKGETDKQALIREIKEELDVVIDPATITPYGTFEGPAFDKPVKVRATCYTASYTGLPKPSSEIEKIAYLSMDVYNTMTPVGKIIFEELKRNDLID